MPHVKPVKGKTGSCAELVDYLEKENKGIALSERESFFSHSASYVQPDQVVREIDSNKKCLRNDEVKYYQVIISPSQKELQHLGNDRAKLQAYTRQVMDEYAQNFGKGLRSEDLVWYAKIERTRHHEGRDTAVRTGQQAQGAQKAGDQTHIHIVVARQSREQKIRLSPTTNHRATDKGPAKFNGGFDRMQFKINSEKAFDRMFQYERPARESVLNLAENKALQRQDHVFAKVQAMEAERKANPVGRTEADKLKAAMRELEQRQQANRASLRTVGTMRVGYEPRQVGQRPTREQNRDQGQQFGR